MKLDATPWARAVLRDELEAEVRGRAPDDARMHVGRGTSNWRAVVTWHGHVLGEARNDDANKAVRQALDGLGN